MHLFIPITRIGPLLLTMRHGTEHLSLLHRDIILLINEPCRMLYQTGSIISTIFRATNCPPSFRRVNADQATACCARAGNCPARPGHLDRHVDYLIVIVVVASLIPFVGTGGAARKRVCLNLPAPRSGGRAAHYRPSVRRLRQSKDERPDPAGRAGADRRVRYRWRAWSLGDRRTSRRKGRGTSVFVGRVDGARPCGPSMKNAATTARCALPGHMLKIGRLHLEPSSRNQSRRRQ